MCLEHVTIIDPSANWLLGRQRNDTSQFGEDGLIEAVFERLYATPQNILQRAAGG